MSRFSTTDLLISTALIAIGLVPIALRGTPLLLIAFGLSIIGFAVFRLLDRTWTGVVIGIVVFLVLVAYVLIVCAFS
jgi:hypothetical protein